MLVVMILEPVIGVAVLVRFPGVPGLVVAVVVRRGLGVVMRVAVLVDVFVRMGVGVGVAVHFVAVAVRVAVDVGVPVVMNVFVSVPMLISVVVFAIVVMHGRLPLDAMAEV
jgi:hypothetical protein